MPLTIPCSWRQVSCGCVPQCTLESKHRTQMAQVTAKIWFMIIGLVSFVLGSIFLTAYFLSPGPPNPPSINNDYGDQMHSNTYPDRQAALPFGAVLVGFGGLILLCQACAFLQADCCP